MVNDYSKSAMIEGGIIILIFFVLCFVIVWMIRRIVPLEIRKDIGDITNKSYAGDRFYGKGFMESDLDKNANHDLDHDGKAK